MVTLTVGDTHVLRFSGLAAPQNAEVVRAALRLVTHGGSGEAHLQVGAGLVSCGAPPEPGDDAAPSYLAQDPKQS